MRKLRRWLDESVTYRIARRIAVAVIGGTVLLIGVAMIVLPGPALVVIPAGLAILGIEFAWARRWLAKVREKADGLVSGVRNAYTGRRPPPGGEEREGPPPSG